MRNPQAKICPVCITELTPWFLKQGVEVLHCRSCGVISIDGGDSPSAVAKSVYEGEDNIFMKNGNERYYLDETNLWSFREKLSWIQRYVASGSRLLEIGSSFGHFLKMSGETYDAVGFDISDVAVAWSRASFGVNAFVASIYDIKGKVTGTFDAITCWDVIEHLPDPATALQILRSFLAPGGTLFLSTPDAGSTVARLEGRFWHYIDPVQHRFLFPRSSLCRLLKKEGFEIKACCSFGHHYRIRYIFDRLLFLHKRGLLRAFIKLARAALFFILGRSVYLKMGDVMGLAATLGGQRNEV